MVRVNRLESKESKVRIKRKWKIIGVIIFITSTIFAFSFVSTFSGSIFDPNPVNLTIGWADIRISYVNFAGKLEPYNRTCSIKLYYAENHTSYRHNLTLDDFPYYLNHPSMIFINDTAGEFQFYYGGLMGANSHDNPYLNEILFKREAESYMVQIGAQIVNFTYTNYSGFDFNNPIITHYSLEYNESNPMIFQFGEFEPLLQVNVLNLPFGYSWGVSTSIPRDMFQVMEISYPIAYQNGFNRIGLYLALDCPYNISILVYGSETYQFFVDMTVYEVNLTQTLPIQKIWVTPLPDVDIIQEITFRFSTLTPFSKLYLWSGYLDDFNSSFIFNSYVMEED
jgi:hypothetical protein